MTKKKEKANQPEERRSLKRAVEAPGPGPAGQFEGYQPRALQRAAASPAPTTPAYILALGRCCGNLAVQRLLAWSRGGGSGGFVLDDGIAGRINRARGSGRPIQSSLQEQMSTRLGYDFSGVRVHADPEAHLLNQRLSARAFTAGQDIFFRQGEYRPGSDSGRKLIAHELTHVVQQNVGRVRQSGRGMIVRPPGDALEREADAVARKVTITGHKATAHHAAVPGTCPQSDTRVTIQRFELADLRAGDISALRETLVQYDEVDPTLNLRDIPWDLLANGGMKVRLDAAKNARASLERFFRAIGFEFATKDKSNLAEDLTTHFPAWKREREQQELREEESRKRIEQSKQMAREAQELYEKKPPIGWSAALQKRSDVANKADSQVLQGAANARGLKITGDGQGLWTGGAGPCVVVALAGPGAVAMVHLDSDTYGKRACLAAVRNLVGKFSAAGGRGGKAYIWGGNDHAAYIHQFRYVYEALKPNVEYWNPTVASKAPVSQVQIVLRGAVYELEKL